MIDLAAEALKHTVYMSKSAPHQRDGSHQTKCYVEDMRFVPIREELKYFTTTLQLEIFTNRNVVADSLIEVDYYSHKIVKLAFLATLCGLMDITYTFCL